MKTRAMVIGLALTAFIGGSFWWSQAQPQQPTLPSYSGLAGYDELIESSQHWDEIDGIKVDPKLGINTVPALHARLAQGYLLTTVDPASGKVTRVAALPSE